MVPSERDLSIVPMRRDKARRARLAFVILVAVVGSLVLVRIPSLAGIPGVYASLVLLVGAGLLAWRTGIIARAHTMLRLRGIRRDGLAATKMLNDGDFAGARNAYAELLVRARLLGAFHAVHVLMFGVTCFLEGSTQEGLTLVERAIDSGWLDQRATREVRNAADTWRVLMLLHAGKLSDARRTIAAAPKGALGIAALALCAHEGDWTGLFDRAARALDDPRFPKASRAAAAALGAYAARQLGRDAADFEKTLQEEELGPLARANPALWRFVSE